MSSRRFFSSSVVVRAVRSLAVVLVSAWPFASAFGKDAEELFESSRWSLVAPHDGPLVAAHPRLGERLGLIASQREQVEKIYRKLLEYRSENSSALRNASRLKEQFPANGATRNELQKARQLVDEIRRRQPLLEQWARGEILATLSGDQKLTLEKLATPTLIVRPLEFRADDLRQLRIDDRGRTLAALRSNVATVFDLSSEGPPRDYAIPPVADPTISSKPSILALSGDGRKLLLGSESPRRGQHIIMATFRIEDQKLLQHYVWPTEPRVPWSSLTFSRDLRRFAGSTYHDGDAIRIWDASDGRELRSLPGLERRTLCFSPDLKLLATGNSREVTVRDATTGVALFTRPVTRLKWMFSFSRDGGRLVVGASNAIDVLDTRTGTPLASFRIPGSEIRSCEFANEDRWLLCRSDKVVSLWDVARGEEVGIFLLQTKSNPYFDAVAASETSTIVVLADGRLSRLSVDDTPRSTAP